MKAVTLQNFGDPSVLNISDCPIPQPNSHELLVRVYATALNRADLLQRRGKYSPPPNTSEILGLEIAGMVESVGDAVTNYKIGDRVCGLVAGGAYAQYCCLDEGLALKIPDDWQFTYAAAIPEVFLTANETAVELGQLKKDENILIHAASSGVGTAAVQLAKQIGAKIFFTAGSEEKIQKVLNLGADFGVNYNTENFSEKILDLTTGVDVIEDFLGGNYFSQNISILKKGGRFICVAFMGGAKAEIDLSVILRNHLQIKGFVLRPRSLIEKREIMTRFKHRWLDALLAKKIYPVIDRIFPFDEVVQAHTYMEERKNFGKIVLEIS